MRHLITLILVLMTTVGWSTEIVPTNRLLSTSSTLWGTNIIGVPGGIRTAYTQFCDVTLSIPGTNIVADPTGVADSQPAIQAACNRCPTNAYVYCPTGRYRFLTNLTLLGNKRILRGAGPGTIFEPDYTNTTGIFINFGAYSEQGTQRTNIVDIPIGATNTTWDSVNGLGALFPGVDGVMKIWENDASVANGFAVDTNGNGSADPVHYSPAGSTKGSSGAPLVRQMFRITGTNTGNQVFFWPPSEYSFSSNKARSQYLYINFLQYSGLEDIHLDLKARVNIGINMANAMGSWIKGVSSFYARKAHVAVNYSYGYEITKCTFDGALTYAANAGIGLHLESHTSGFHIYDNVMRSNYPAIEIYLGHSVGAIQHNYFLNSQGGLAPIDIHNAHNFKVLVQGNVGYGFLQDGYFGGADKWLLFRNWFHGSEAAFGARKVLNLGHFTRDFTVLNNVLGNPYTNWVAYIQQSGWNNSNTAIRRYGYPNMGNDTYTGTNNTIQATNYPFMDFFVWSNTLEHANIEYRSIGTWTTNYDAGTTNRTYRYSYWNEHDSQYPPPYWTNTGLVTPPWPPIGEDVAGYTNLIPAMVRFHNLTDSGGGPPPTPPEYDDDFMRILQWFFFPIITHPLWK